MLFNRQPKPAAGPTPEELAKKAADEATVQKAAEDKAKADAELTAKSASITKEEFTAFQTSMNEKFDNVTNYFMQQNKPGQTQQTATTPTIEDVTDEEYENAIAGHITDKRQAAAVVSKRQAAAIMRATQGLQQKIDQLQTVGMQAISGLTAQGLASRPHYKEYKKEIDQMIATLPPEARVNAEALDGVYKLVIGGHIDEIMSKERETALRQAAAPTQTGTPAGRTEGAKTNTAASGATPQPQDALEPLALAAIRDKYGSTGPEAIDRFVRGQGMKTWDEYYTKYLKPLEETQGNA